jgi:hypothetical protein
MASRKAVVVAVDSSKLPIAALHDTGRRSSADTCVPKAALDVEATKLEP